MAQSDLSVVIQAGGESRRMGQDKALVSFRGQPLILRVIAGVAPLSEYILVTTNSADKLDFLNVPVVADLLPGPGALIGLYTALSISPTPLVAVVACDMPFVSAALLAAQRNWLVESGCDAVIPRHEKGAEPFHAVYRCATCLPLIRAALESGRQRIDSWFSQAKIRFVAPEETSPYDPSGLAYWNVNTPQELAEAESFAASMVDNIV